jgi:hypothetical protein
MKCGECGGTMRYAQVTLNERFGDVRFVIEGIPALVLRQLWHEGSVRTSARGV